MHTVLALRSLSTFPMHLPDIILQLCLTDPQRMQVVTRLQAALCV